KLFGSGLFSGRSFLRRVLGFFDGGSLGGLLFSALGGLLARLGLVRVVACVALGQAGGVEETQHAVGRLGANAEPMLGTLGVQHDAAFIVLGQQRIEGAQL